MLGYDSKELDLPPMDLDSHREIQWKVSKIGAGFLGKIDVNPTSQGVLEAALRLSEIERAQVVQELLQSLSPNAERLVDDAWAAELDLRLLAFQHGDADAVPWSQLRDEK